MIIKNGIIITQEKPNRILEGYAIYIEGSKIVEINEQTEILSKHPDKQIIDACGKYVMPGNICAHTHFYGAYSRGLAIPGDPAKDFPEILQKLWWQLDKSLNLQDVKQSALVCIIDAIKHGTTTLFDHHASPMAINGSLEAIAQAVEVSGIRASLCYEVTDRDGEQKRDAGIHENKAFIGYLQRNRPLEGKLAAMFGLHASLTLSDVSLDKCREATPDNIGFHIHVAEHSIDEYDSLNKSGLRVVERLDKHRILGPKSIVVHAVHVDASEIEILADTRTWVTHQPRSNMNNAVGIANTEDMLRMGIKVCIGNDGFSNTMWEEWKTTYLVHKLWRLDPRRMNGLDVFTMGVYNNSELVNTIFEGQKTGMLQPGYEADIILVDYHPFTPMNAGNLPWHILFGFNESMVTTTIVQGKILMDNRQLLTLDEEKIACETLKLSPQTWKRFSEKF